MSGSPSPPGPKGRGSQLKPHNRFDRVHVEDDFEQLEHDDEFLASLEKLPTEYLEDDSRTIVSENDSPDIPFRYSANPYRGCLHGCSYCYARPSHEYLGLNAGIDFETKIFVKLKAAELFREFLCRDRWKPEVIVFSGITDCYQPAERRFRLTRQCLEVALEARQPVGIITKNALIVRDRDLLKELAQRQLLRVNISVTTLDPELASTMEPRTSTPAARLRAITALREVGVPVNVMVAPVIPGLNDSEIPAILKAVSEAGAQHAGMTVLRLPLNVKPVFQEWLARTQPHLQEKIESRIRACRGGAMSSSEFGERMTGTGQIADQIQQTFRLFRKRYGLEAQLPVPDASNFRPPRDRRGQLRLFE
ncbi:PA0069 family radical SAM protein [Planctomicrobium sp. SH661]|uniref:PA0069 family radical SAM protein n=1 Tax=Planctomicrobium sp. SH661 TaxID=3448124 RepID=UPI003F5C0A0C